MKSHMVEALGLLPSAPDGFSSLRQLILDLAMSGRLVEQSPEDEPAHALRERIVKARAELLGATKVRGAGKDDGAASPSCSVSLPPSWLMVPLTDVYVTVSAHGGQLLSSQIVGAGKFPVVDQGKRFIAGYTNREDLVIKLPGPVVVFGDHTTERKYIDFDFVVGADGVKILRPILVNERFFWLQLVGYRLESRGYARHFKVLNACWFALPPLEEQNRIVAKVDELMALCDRLEARQHDAVAAHARLVQAMLDSLTQARDAEEFQACWERVASNFDETFTTDGAIDKLKQSVLHMAVTGKLSRQLPSDAPAIRELSVLRNQNAINEGSRRRRPRADSNVGAAAVHSIPQGWEWCVLGDVVDVLNGRAYKKEELLSAGTPVLRVGNLFTSNHWYYSDLVLDDDKYCEPGDLIFAWSASFGPFIWSGDRVIYHYHIWKLRPHVEAAISKLYLHLFLLERTQAIKAAGHGVSMAHMTKEKMEVLPVALPPLAEQHRIVAKVTELLALCDQLKARIAAARGKHAELAEALVESAIKQAH